MKQVTITTGKATIVVVDLPEGAFNIKCVSFRPYGIYYIVKSAKAPRGKVGCFVKTDFQVMNLGHVSKVSDDLWDKIVDWNEEHLFYFKYPNKDWQGDITATESGLSLLKANGVVMDNPLGEEPLRYTPDIGSDFVPYHNKWLEAQKDVWLNPQIFVKV